jgi:hypothetical protein
MLLTEGEKKESIFKGNSSLSAEGATHPAKRDDNPFGSHTKPWI